MMPNMRELENGLKKTTCYDIMMSSIIFFSSHSVTGCNFHQSEEQVETNIALILKNIRVF